MTNKTRREMHAAVCDYVKDNFAIVAGELDREIASDLDRHFSKRDQTENIPYHGRQEVFFRTLGLIDDSNVLTSKARQWYTEFENANFYSPE